MRNRDTKIQWVLLITIIGFALRLFVSTLGHNYDYESYLIVIDIIKRGGNVYEQTSRYNYGFIWAYLITGLSILVNNSEQIYRYVLVVFLTFVDMGISRILWKRNDFKTAAIFFLNPVSIIITGFHNQFDNLAILIAMLAVIRIGDEFDLQLTKQKVSGSILLGISLITKHVFFAFPLWIAVKQRGLIKKIILILIPISLFLISFVPFLGKGANGIQNNVFFYLSKNNAIFYNFFILPFIKNIINSGTFWLLTLIITAFVFKSKNSFDSLLLYSAIMVSTSPGLANQYFIIPMAYLAVNFNIFTIGYWIVTTWYLMVDHNGFSINLLRGIFDISRGDYYTLIVVMLTSAVIWNEYQMKIKEWGKSIINEIRTQFTLFDQS